MRSHNDSGEHRGKMAARSFLVFVWFFRADGATGAKVLCARAYEPQEHLDVEDSNKKTDEGNITALQQQIDRVQCDIRSAESRVEEYDEFRKAFVAKIQLEAQNQLLESPVLKGMKLILYGAVLVGILVWIGGSIHGVFQIKSVGERSNQVQQELVIEVARVKQAVNDALESVGDAKVGLVPNATKQLDQQIERVSNGANDALDAIEATKRRFDKALSPKRLEDLEAIQAQVNQLIESDGKLKIATIRSLISKLTLGLFLLNLILIFLVVYFWLKWRKLNRK